MKAHCFRTSDGPSLFLVRRMVRVVMAKLIDITGQRFGRLVVVRRGDTSSDGKAMWVCLCDCGEVTEVRSYQLRSGITKSCGCLFRETSSVTARQTNNKYGLDSNRNVSANKSKHGDIKPYASYSRLYHVWTSMKQRCNNPHAPNYAAYGGRGIRICDEWMHDFKAFESWAFAHGYDQDAPKGQCTLDRIDVDGNYSPSNCRWADPKTQRHNRRDSRRLEVS